MRKPLQECLLQAGPSPDRLAVFDLSRTTSRETLSEVANAIAAHPEWERCKHCHLNAGGKVCPIAENRRRLLGDADGGRLARRLGDLVEIARLNGLHLPVRDLLALCANMVLGYADAKLTYSPPLSLDIAQCERHLRRGHAVLQLVGNET